jgi:outer membrane protein assembly factor BamB
MTCLARTLMPCNRLLANCGKSLPPQDAAISDPQKPWLFEVSPKWTRFGPHSRAGAMKGFFHGQLDWHSLLLSMLVILGSAMPLPAEETERGGLLPSLATRGGEDWPSFLGPRGDGTSSLAEIPLPWPDSGPRIVWHAEMGEGYGAPAVALGRIVLFDRVGNRARLRCLHAETGEPLWEVSDPTAYRDSFGYDGGPRCCPVIAGDRVLSFAADGLLTCRRLADGSTLWQIDTSATYHVVQNFFGVGAAPLVIDAPTDTAPNRQLAIVPIGGSEPGSEPPAPERLDLVKGADSGVVAFDLADGSEVWRTSDQLASYSSPVLTTLGGPPRLLAWMREQLLAVDPATGRETGSFRWRADELFSVNAANPVVLRDAAGAEQVLLSETYGPGAVLLDVEATPRGDTFTPVWTSPKGARPYATLKAHWATPVVHDGHLYGTSGRNAGDAQLVCVEIATGEVRWAERGLARASVVLAGEQLLVIGEFGEVLVVKATPEAYTPLAETTLTDPDTGNPLLAPPCWAAPVIARGCAYLRGAGRVVCIDLVP